MVLPDEVRQRVASYLVHQGGKDVPAIVEVIERERRRLTDLLSDLSEGQAGFVPSPGQWSIRDVVRHVVAAERGVVETIAGLASVVAPLDDTPVAGQSAAALRQRLDSVRAQLLGLVRGLPGDVNLELKHEHFFFGPLNWKEWLAFQRVHDGDHIQQIEAIQGLSSYPRA